MQFKNVYHFSFVLILFTCMTGDAFSQNINTPENFPDPKFRAIVEEFMGVAPGGEFSAAEASIKGGMLMCSNRGIKEMSGIEYFHALKFLQCKHNDLKNLDITKNNALNTLNCGRNQLTRLDLSHNVALEFLDCSSNQLTSLDVSNKSTLRWLRV